MVCKYILPCSLVFLFCWLFPLLYDILFFLFLVPHSLSWCHGYYGACNADSISYGISFKILLSFKILCTPSFKMLWTYVITCIKQSQTSNCVCKLLFWHRNWVMSSKAKVTSLSTMEHIIPNPSPDLRIMPSSCGCSACMLCSTFHLKKRRQMPLWVNLPGTWKPHYRITERTSEIINLVLSFSEKETEAQKGAVTRSWAL